MRSADPFLELQGRVRANSVMLMSIIAAMEPDLRQHLLKGMENEAKGALREGDHSYATALANFGREIRVVAGDL